MNLGKTLFHQGWKNSVAASRRLLNLADYLFGYDFFISYAQGDPEQFGKRLKQALEEKPKPLRCFIDTEGFAISDELTKSTIRHLRRSRRLILVGSAQAVASPWVQKEISLFISLAKDNKNKIVALDVMETIRKLEASHPIRQEIPYADRPDKGESRLLLVIDEAEFQQGPSAQTTAKIRHLVGQKRVDHIRTRVIQFVIFILIAFSVATSWLAQERGEALNKAKQNLASALTNLAVAERREGRSNRAVALAAEALTLNDNLETRRFLAETTPAELIANYSLPAKDAATLAISSSRYFAIGRGDGGLQLVNLITGEWLPVAYPESGSGTADVFEMTFTHDAKRIVVSSDNGSVTVFDVPETGMPNIAFEAMTVDPGYNSENNPFVWNRAVFLADGRLVIIAENSTVSIFDLSGHKQKPDFSLPESGAGVSAVVAHGQKPEIALAYAGGRIMILRQDLAGEWKFPIIRENLPFGETLGGSVSISAMAYDPDPQRQLEPGDERNRFAVAGNDGIVRLIADDGELLHQISFPRQTQGTPIDNVSSVAFSESGQRLIALRDNGGLGVWRKKGEWALERVLDTQEVAFNGQMRCCIGDAAAVTLSAESGDYKDIKIWDLSSSEYRASLLVEGRYAYADASITALNFDQSGQHLAIGTSSGHVMVAKVENRQIIAVSRPPTFENYITWVGFRPNRFELVSTSHSGVLRLFNLNDCQQQSITVSEELSELYAGAWSLEGNTLYVTPFDLYPDDSELWEVSFNNDAIQARQLMVLNNSVDQLVTLGSGWLAANTSEGVIAIDTENKLFEELTKQSGPLAVLNQQGKPVLLMSAINDSIAQWLRVNKVITPLNDVPCEVDEPCSAWQIAIDPKGVWFAASISGEIDIRRIDNGLLVARLSDHASQIDALAVSPDGRTLASGGLGGRVMLWELGALLDSVKAVNASSRATTGLEVNAQGTIHPIPSEQNRLILPEHYLTKWLDTHPLAIDMQQDAFLESPRVSCIK